jgi:hypothetical protein
MGAMSPTVFREGAYRFYFFSREERRAHIHVNHPSGGAKFWLEPSIELAINHGLTPERLGVALRLIRKHEDEIRAAWQRHFSS